jgi:hypothetical protein
MLNVSVLHSVSQRKEQEPVPIFQTETGIIQVNGVSFQVGRVEGGVEEAKAFLRIFFEPGYDAWWDGDPHYSLKTRAILQIAEQVKEEGHLPVDFEERITLRNYPLPVGGRKIPLSIMSYDFPNKKWQESSQVELSYSL